MNISSFVQQMEDRKGRTVLDMAKKANFHEAIAILEPSVRNSLASWLPGLGREKKLSFKEILK
jgi:hypothetical protein